MPKTVQKRREESNGPQNTPERKGGQGPHTPEKKRTARRQHTTPNTEGEQVPTTNQNQRDKRAMAPQPPQKKKEDKEPTHHPTEKDNKAPNHTEKRRRDKVVSDRTNIAPVSPSLYFHKKKKAEPLNPHCRSEACATIPAGSAAG